MNRMTRTTTCLTLIGALTIGASATSAQQADAGATYTKKVDGSFADVTFAVEQAITNEGLVIDSVNHVGAMLSRTKEDVGGEKTLFLEADTFNFCSAVVSRQVMEADITNIRFCPYGIFVYEAADTPGKIVVGHRTHAVESMAPVDEMLGRIVDTATE